MESFELKYLSSLAMKNADYSGYEAWLYRPGRIRKE